MIDGSYFLLSCECRFNMFSCF
ncbi:hypothetical protein D0440_22195 [Priestia megaterium]|nr:hypothetical protein D0440_22195 [Priestia megaterium]